MPLTIQQAVDSYLKAKVRIKEWEIQFQARYYGPLYKVMINTAIENAKKSPMIDQQKLINSLTPEARERFIGGK